MPRTYLLCNSMPKGHRQSPTCMIAALFYKRRHEGYAPLYLLAIGVIATPTKVDNFD